MDFLLIHVNVYMASDEVNLRRVLKSFGKLRVKHVYFFHDFETHYRVNIKLLKVQKYGQPVYLNLSTIQEQTFLKARGY